MTYLCVIYEIGIPQDLLMCIKYWYKGRGRPPRQSKSTTTIFRHFKPWTSLYTLSIPNTIIFLWNVRSPHTVRPFLSTADPVPRSTDVQITAPELRSFNRLSSFFFPFFFFSSLRHSLARGHSLGERIWSALDVQRDPRERYIVVRARVCMMFVCMCLFRRFSSFSGPAGWYYLILRTVNSQYRQ